MALHIYEDIVTGRHHWADPTSKNTVTRLAAGDWVLFDATPDTPPPSADPLGQEMAERVTGNGPFAVELRAAFMPQEGRKGWAFPALSKWSRARSRVLAGTGEAKILCLGDSTTAGVGVDGVSTQGLPNAYPHQLARLLDGAGLPSARGLGIPPPSSSTAPDPRWTLGAGWARAAGLGFASRSDFAWTGSTVGNLVYADAVLADRFDVYYATGSSGVGAFTATATGGAATPVNAAGSNGITKVTLSAASAATTNTVTIVPSNTGAVHILGIEPWLSTRKQVRVGNAGVGHSRATADWAANQAGGLAPWNSAKAIQAYAPDLTIISLGLNDGDYDDAVPAFESAIDYLIPAAQVTGDVILMTPIPPTAAATASMKTKVPLYSDVMRAQGLPLVDLVARWGSGDAASALGFYWDPVHPNGLGYADIASVIGRGLLDA